MDEQGWSPNGNGNPDPILPKKPDPVDEEAERLKKAKDRTDEDTRISAKTGLEKTQTPDGVAISRASFAGGGLQSSKRL